MELLFRDPYYDTDAWDSERFRAEIAKEMTEADPDARVVTTDVGLAADFPSLLVQLFSDLDWKSLLGPAAFGALFFMGEKIEKNLDAWVKIGKRLRGILERRPATRIDERAAVLLVISELDDTSVAGDGIQVSVQVVVLTPGPGTQGRLDRRPDALYLVTVRTKDAVWVFVVKSTGQVLFKLRQPTSWLEFS